MTVVIPFVQAAGTAKPCVAVNLIEENTTRDSYHERSAKEITAAAYAG